MTAEQLDFDPPGPGSWTRERAHTTRPSPAIGRFGGGLQRGFASSFARYGMPLAGFEIAFVQGWPYMQMVPVPPDELSQRAAVAAEAFAERRWRGDLERWDTEVKPDSIRRNRALASVDVDALAPDELLTHLHACIENADLMAERHHMFNGAAMIPVADYLAQVQEWTGLPQVEVLGLLEGASPMSGGDSAELDALVAAVAGDGGARALLANDIPAEQILDGLAGSAGAVGEAAREYLITAGHRLLSGMGIDEPMVLEAPELVVRALRARVAQGPRPAPDVSALEARVRDAVPEERRAEFDDLLTEARLVYRLRDERGLYNDIWALGITRKAVLAVGRRLAEKGLVEQAVHAIDATRDELASLLLSGAGPSPTELARRHTTRMATRDADAPRTLGDPPAPPPPLEMLPPEMARVVRAFITLGGSPAPAAAPDDQPADVLAGVAGARGTAEGPARVIAGPWDLERIEDGDVLVTQCTTEAFNLVLPFVAAIVTEVGGLLSHAAIVAREFGIPAVVECPEATARIPDGARVRVDGDSGKVMVIQR